VREEQLLQRGKVQLAGICDRADAQLDSLIVPQHLPRYQVRVVLHLGEHNYITGF